MEKRRQSAAVPCPTDHPPPERNTPGRATSLLRKLTRTTLTESKPDLPEAIDEEHRTETLKTGDVIYTVTLRRARSHTGGVTAMQRRASLPAVPTKVTKEVLPPDSFRPDFDQPVVGTLVRKSVRQNRQANLHGQAGGMGLDAMGDVEEEEDPDEKPLLRIMAESSQNAVSMTSPPNSPHIPRTPSRTIAPITAVVEDWREVNRVIRCAPVHLLIAALAPCALTSNDLYVRMFFVTYRSFTTPRVVCAYLLHHFVAPEDALPHVDSDSGKKLVVDVIGALESRSTDNIDIPSVPIDTAHTHHHDDTHSHSSHYHQPHYTDSPAKSDFILADYPASPRHGRLNGENGGTSGRRQQQEETRETTVRTRVALAFLAWVDCVSHDFADEAGRECLYWIGIFVRTHCREHQCTLKIAEHIQSLLTNIRPSPACAEGRLASLLNDPPHAIDGDEAGLARYHRPFPSVATLNEQRTTSTTSSCPTITDESFTTESISTMSGYDDDSSSTGSTTLKHHHHLHKGAATITANPLSRHISLCDWQATEIASQLMLADATLYLSLVPNELFGGAFSRKDKRTGAASVFATIDHFNRLTSAVCAEILSLDTPELRARLIQFLIDVAVELRKLNDFTSLKGVVSALQTQPVYRLKRSWEGVSKDHIAALRSLEKILSEAKNMTALREALMATSPPCVPYLGVFLTDLTMIDTKYDNVVDGRINFEKRRKEFEVIEQILWWKQNLQSGVIERTHINSVFQQWLRCAPPYSDVVAYDLSLLREPKVENVSSMHDIPASTPLSPPPAPPPTATTTSSPPTESKPPCNIGIDDPTSQSRMPVSPRRQTELQQQNTEPIFYALPSVVPAPRSSSDRRLSITEDEANESDHDKQERIRQSISGGRVVRVSLDRNRLRDYRSIVVEETSSCSWVIERSIEKYNLESEVGEHVLSMVISTTTKGRELQATSVGSPVSEEALVWPLVDVGSSRFVLESRIMYTQQCEGTRRRLHKKNSLGLRSRVKPSSPPSQLSAMHELTIEEEHPAVDRLNIEDGSVTSRSNSKRDASRFNTMFRKKKDSTTSGSCGADLS